MERERGLRLSLLDDNGPRLQRAERLLRACLRRHAPGVELECLGCGLEIARRGFAGRVPVLLLQGNLVLSAGRELEVEWLELICRKLGQKQSAPAGKSG